MIDFNLFGEVSDKPIINTDEEYVVQQIEMLFRTDTESVLGDLSYGTNYDRYVYGMGISNTALESKILGDLKTLDLGMFNPSVSVSFIEGTVRDIALIDITLMSDGGYEVFKKTYMIK
jgi:hypothetical protein